MYAIRSYYACSPFPRRWYANTRASICTRCACRSLWDSEERSITEAAPSSVRELGPQRAPGGQSAQRARETILEVGGLLLHLDHGAVADGHDESIARLEAEGVV